MKKQIQTNTVSRRHALTTNEAGFTFVEMLLVLFIFIIVAVAASDIFMRTQRSQSSAASMQRLQDDVRFTMTKITDDIRTGSIDYSCYKHYDTNTYGACGVQIDPANGNDVLALKNTQGKTTLYKIANETGANACIDAKSVPCLLISDNAGSTWLSMTQKGTRFDSAKTRFFINSTSSPFVLNANNHYISSEQPRVTMRLEALADIKGLSYPVKLPLQTTVVTREYQR